MTQVARFDFGEIQPKTFFNDEGFLVCDAIVTRTGVFNYRNPDGTLRRELRDPNDVLNEESLNSMKMIPITNEHPKERLITSDNAKELSVGFTGENIRQSGKFIMANFVVTDKETINDIVNNNKKQLSLGYTVDLIEERGDFDGENYDFKQTNIKYNHLSIVREGRAGVQAKIALDEADAVEVDKKEVQQMGKKKVKIDQDEFFMEEEAAVGVEQLLEKFKALESEKEAVDAELEATKTKLETALAERDNAVEEAQNVVNGNSSEEDSSDSDKDRDKENNDSADFEKKVKDRVKLIKQAESVLDENDLEKLYGMSEIEIKKKIIKSKNENAKLDDKSDIYVCARFDAMMDDMPKNNVIVKTVGKSKNDSNFDAVSSREKMINDMKNAYKTKGGN